MGVRRYKSIEPFQVGYLSVSNLHTLYYELSGNEDGIPVLFVHGGPGCSSSGEDRRYFDPKFYKIVLYHQRGVGLSQPKFELNENTTQELVSDLERLRQHLNLGKVLLFGISWGTTLCLLYYLQHPNYLYGLILNGVFLGTQKEFNFTYQRGASLLFPDHWSHFLNPIPEEERNNLILAYYKRIHHTNGKEREQCRISWSTWESVLYNFQLSLNGLERAKADQKDSSHIWLLLYYFQNRCFLKDNYILEEIKKLKLVQVPIVCVQGRYDLVTPVKFAFELKKWLPQVELIIVEDGGHNSKQKGIRSKLTQVCNSFRDKLKV